MEVLTTYEFLVDAKVPEGSVKGIQYGSELFIDAAYLDHRCKRRYARKLRVRRRAAVRELVGQMRRDGVGAVLKRLAASLRKSLL